MTTTFYTVKIARFCTGTRIEAYSNDCFIFTDKQKALKCAYEKASEFLIGNHRRVNGKWVKIETLEYDINGEYYLEGSGGYDEWPDYISTVKTITLDVDGDMVGHIGFSDGEWRDQVQEMKEHESETDEDEDIISEEPQVEIPEPLSERDRVNLIINLLENLEASTGMDEEFGDTVGEMMEKTRDVMGDKADTMLLQLVKDLTSWSTDNEETKMWYDTQKPLLPEISGMEVTTHQFDPDEPGACLYGDFGRYTLEVSIEDKKTIEAITGKDGYYSVVVVDKEPGLDGEMLFFSGVVFTVDQILELIGLITKEDVEAIIRLVHGKHYSPDADGWIDTCEETLVELIERAKSGWYTSQVNINK